MSIHWLDDVIALVRREGQRWAGGNPDKAGQHETAAALLERVRESNVSHDGVRAHLATPDEPRPEPEPQSIAQSSVEAPTAPADAPVPSVDPDPTP